MIPPSIKIKPCDAGPSNLPAQLEVTCHFFGYYFSNISKPYVENWEQEHALTRLILGFKDFDTGISKLFKYILELFISRNVFNKNSVRTLWWNGLKDDHNISRIGFVAIPPHDINKESPIKKLISEFVADNLNYYDCSNLIIRTKKITKGTRSENKRYDALNINNSALYLLEKVDQIIILDDVYTTGTSMKAAAYHISDIIEERMIDIQCLAFAKTVAENEAKEKLATNLDDNSIFFPQNIENASSSDRKSFIKSLENIN
tara:strand:+ start:1154 stop:1933 length:780 start_codon:yes stop_codon:yes gene_type:complete